IGRIRLDAARARCGGRGRAADSRRMNGGGDWPGWWWCAGTCAPLPPQHTLAASRWIRAGSRRSGFGVTRELRDPDHPINAAGLRFIGTMVPRMQRGCGASAWRPGAVVMPPATAVDDRLMDERPKLAEVVDVARRIELRQVHHHQLLLRIHPVRGVIRPAPPELADRAVLAALAGVGDDGKPEAFSDAGPEHDGRE